MSALTLYNEQGNPAGARITDHVAIAEALQMLGVRFERWEASHPLASDAGEADVTAAYREAIERLNGEYGFQSMDVVAVRPDHPRKAEMRGKFLGEHTHSDFEVRFFVEGGGLFYLHADGRVYAVLCEKGDLISVPGEVPHWFDMGKNPDFKCIRFFTIPDGWVAEFTGSDIGGRFPSLDAYRAGA